MTIRSVLSLLLALAFLAMPVTVSAQNNSEAPGGASDFTLKSKGLEDILKRQKALKEDPQQYGAVPSRPDIPINTLQTGSISDIYRAARSGTNGEVRVSARGPATDVMIQTTGMEWLSLRAGPLRTWGGYLLVATVVLLAVFYLVRGKMRISSGRSGTTIERFNATERFFHWLMAGSFILLAITGLVTLFGRVAIIPLMGKAAYAPIAGYSKFIHDYVSWVFMVSLAVVFLMWVVANIPNKLDWIWIKQGGGFFSKDSHPPAKKFNAGQKIVFWSVILFGTTISVSGLSLLFPFELPLFAKTFGVLNTVGFGLPTDLSPQAEMQLAQIWHAAAGFILMAIIIGHIYIGTLGMEGAAEAMTKGEVDLNWAREHHSEWVKEGTHEVHPHDQPNATPAE